MKLKLFILSTLIIGSIKPMDEPLLPEENPIEQNAVPNIQEVNPPNQNDVTITLSNRQSNLYQAASNMCQQELEKLRHDLSDWRGPCGKTLFYSGVTLFCGALTLLLIMDSSLYYIIGK